MKLAEMKVDKHSVGKMQAINPNYLNLVDVHAIPESIYRTIASDIRERGCYTNAVVAGVRLDAKSIVLGVVHCNNFGISCEHAWIELKNGEHVDPTYQRLGHFNPSDYQYYSLFTVQMDEYLEIAAAIRGKEDMALDFLSMRRSPLTKHLFKMDRSNVG